MIYKSLQDEDKQSKKLMTTLVNRFAYLLWNIFILISIIVPAQAQELDKEKIDFTVADIKLSSALIMLADESNMNFSYNSDESLFDTKINYSAENKSPLIILDDLLKDTDHSFKMIGNQVVIYQDSSKTPKPVVVVPVQPTTTKEEPVRETITEYLTQTVFDTVYIVDTLVEFKTDTVYVVDTIIVEKEKPKKLPPTKIKEIPVDYFNQEDSRESGWSGSVFIAPIFTDFSLVRDESKVTLRSFSLGIEASKLYNNWNFKGSFHLTHFGEKFDHSYIFIDGGFFVTDTIDEYYTVAQNDTIYYYVTDSTWKPASSQEYNYTINNRIGLLELGLSVSYDFYKNRSARFYGRLGAQVGFMLYSSGMALPYLDQPDGLDFADLTFSPQSFSALAGIGMKYRLNKNFDFNSEVYYVRYLNNIVDDYPVSTKISGVGVKLGLIYYF